MILSEEEKKKIEEEERYREKVRKDVNKTSLYSHPPGYSSELVEE